MRPSMRGKIPIAIQEEGQMKAQPSTTKRPAWWAIMPARLHSAFLGTVVCLMLVAGCGEDNATVEPLPPPEPPPPDLSGMWAGTWQGTNPAAGGQVTGNWEAELFQTQTEVTGSQRLSGDVDCPDGTLAGSATDDVVSGPFTRSPCPVNEWTLTALILAERTAGGIWTQPAAGAKVVKHARYTCFQMAEVSIPRNLFAAILGRIRRLIQPVPV